MEQTKLIRLDPEGVRRAAPLFDGCSETMVWSPLEGTMGGVWALEGQESESALSQSGDFVCLAGKPSADLLSTYHADRGERFAILTTHGISWGGLIEREYGERAQKKTRYGILKQGDVFNRDKLRSYIAALPEGMTLKRIDHELYKWCMDSDWACDFCSNFESAEDFAARGLGWMAISGGEPVGGASSYTCYKGGIEIEVDTRSDMRRRGIATACSARLILSCLERGLYPSWDAANRESVALALKLGYTEGEPYPAWHVNE